MPICRFNTAEIGAMSRDIPHEARILVKRMFSDPKVNVTEQWKVSVCQTSSRCSCLGWSARPEGQLITYNAFGRHHNVVVFFVSCVRFSIFSDTIVASKGVVNRFKEHRDVTQTQKPDN